MRFSKLKPQHRQLIYQLTGTLLFLAINIFFYFETYKEQLNFHSQNLYNQAEITGSRIEWKISQVRSDINYILYTDNVAGIFKSDDIQAVGQEKFKLFNTRYGDLVSGLQVVDWENHVLSIFKSKSGIYKSDYYISQQTPDIQSVEKTEHIKEIFRIYQPYFENDKVVGNVIVDLDLHTYIFSEFNNYYKDESIFQWLYMDSTFMSSTNPYKSFYFSESEQIKSELINENSGFIKHKVTFDQMKYRPVITAYYPVNVFNETLGIGFSLDSHVIINNVVKRGLIITILSLLFVFFTVPLAFFLNPNRVPEKKKKTFSRLNALFDDFPGGLILTNTNFIITEINKNALELLDIDLKENLTGHNIADIGIFNEYTRSSGTTAFDKNHIFPLKNGKVIFINDNVISIDGETYLIHLMIDVTIIDRGRKQEQAANTAKSEFLAKMTHEIRTPMSGIIGMADALWNEDLSVQQKEYVDIVKKSAHLLMMIINDILDYSKIEAGKMLLEEVPFKMSQEIKYAIDLFKPIARQKHVHITTVIKPEVPDNIVGDPYRLRQVISNLISNAVKFTNEGEIQVRVSVEEKYDANITLLFEVEDTGIGMSKEDLTKIFNSYSQAGMSVARKFGGTGLGTNICKQLVNLMNGEIWAESPSKLSKSSKYPGSKFSFTIEAYLDTKVDKAIDVKMIKNPEDINIAILSPESEDGSFFNLFSRRGFKLHFIKDIPSLLPSLENGAIQLLVVYDTVDMSGFQLAQELFDRKLTDKNRIIILGKNDQHGNYIQSKNLGVDNYLIEPFEHRDIEKLILEYYPELEFLQDENLLNLDMKILIAEDNVFNQKVAQTIFKNIGFIIDIVSDGIELIERVEKQPYDLIFTDLEMPGKSGWDITRELREQGYKKPIIAMTASANDKIKKEALRAGMDDYITKPFEIKTIRNLLFKYSLALKS